MDDARKEIESFTTASWANVPVFAPGLPESLSTCTFSIDAEYCGATVEQALPTVAAKKTHAHIASCLINLPFPRYQRLNQVLGDTTDEIVVMSN